MMSTLLAYTKMLAACLKQNALQNISCRVIEFFTLQYHTHAVSVSFKSIKSSYGILKHGWSYDIEETHWI